MKPLILLFFFTFTAGAQTDSLHNARDCARLQEMRRLRKIVEFKAASQRSASIFDSVLKEASSHGERAMITVSDLEGYLAECEASLDTVMVKIYNDYSGTWEETLHRMEKREPTLKGFLEYLKRRRK